MDSQGFVTVDPSKKRRQRQERRRQQFITGYAPAKSGGFKGAPEPSRDLFLYRVDPESETADLRTHLNDMDVTVRALHQISNESARYKSFRLTIPLSDFDILLDSSLWPEGVRVRRYFPRKDEASSSRGTVDGRNS